MRISPRTSHAYVLGAHAIASTSTEPLLRACFSKSLYLALSPPLRPVEVPWKLHAADELLEALALRVRAFSLEQIRRTWWSEVSSAAARSRLERLRLDGLVTLHRTLARAELELVRPLAVWQPGEAQPALAAVARLAHARWSTPPRSTLCAVATPATGVRFAGRGGRPPRESEWTHDLQLAQVYLLLRANDSRRARQWQNEDLAQRPKSTSPTAGEKLPDAIVEGAPGRTAIELVGHSYGREKLEAFHDFCHANDLPYELW